MVIGSSFLGRTFYSIVSLRPINQFGRFTLGLGGSLPQEVRTGGPWTASDLNRLINELELLAALKTLQCFTSSLSNASVEIKMDNTTAVSYVNRLGAPDRHLFVP